MDDRFPNIAGSGWRLMVQVEVKPDKMLLLRLMKRTIHRMHAFPPHGNALEVGYGTARRLKLGQRNLRLGDWRTECHQLPCRDHKIPTGRRGWRYRPETPRPGASSQPSGHGCPTRRCHQKTDDSPPNFGTHRTKSRSLDSMVGWEFRSRRAWLTVRAIRLATASWPGSNDDADVLMVSGRDGHFRIHHHGQLLVND